MQGNRFLEIIKMKNYPTKSWDFTNEIVSAPPGMGMAQKVLLLVNLLNLEPVDKNYLYLNKTINSK